MELPWVPKWPLLFMADIDTEILSQSMVKPIVWKRYIDDISPLWHVSKSDIEQFIKRGNSRLATIKFTAEISNTETTFLDTIVHKGKRFQEQSILDIKTHFKPTETFQYAHFSSSHPPGVKKGFVNGEALRLLRTNSSETTFEENIKEFKSRLKLLQVIQRIWLKSFYQISNLPKGNWL